MKIRELKGDAITEAVRQLCLQANRTLPADVKAAMDRAMRAEPWPLAQPDPRAAGRKTSDAAAQKELPICQDTGMACVFIELGQDVHVDGDLHRGGRRGRPPRLRRGLPAQKHHRRPAAAQEYRRQHPGFSDCYASGAGGPPAASPSRPKAPAART